MVVLQVANSDLEARW